MSVFGKLFGTKKEQPELNTQQSLQKLQETEEMLLKKHAFLESKVKTELDTARAHGTKNKRLALQALKRKKNFEQQMQHIDGVLNTIQSQKTSLENASMNSDVLQVISSSAKALKQAHKDMNVDQVHDLMEDINEQQEVANEIANAISNPIGLGNDVDEDDLLKELETMEEEELSKQLLDVDVAQKDITSTLPAAPTSEIATASSAHKSKQKDHDDELAELEAWANA